MRHRRLRDALPVAVLGAAVCLAGHGVQADRGRLADIARPRRDEAARRVVDFKRRLAEARQHWPRFLTDTSRNAALRSRGLLTGPAAQVRRAARPATASQPDTARVLLVRLGFRSNREPNLTSIRASGDSMGASGHFQLQPDSTAIIDPPPHDARYCESLLLGMRSYYDTQSYGKLVVEGTVFPAQGDSSIKLSDAADYGPGAGGNWSLELLEKYFRDAVKRLGEAAAGRLDLGRYDALMFMHPGSDLQNDVNRDSPNDLPTFFMTLADSIVVQDSIQVRDGLIFPETLNQDGMLGGVLGGMCHEFGHQLGLPDWYDTRLGLPVLGEWDLMDSGNAALFAFQEEENGPIYVAYGLLPTGMSTMDRWLLRWDEPYAMRAPQDQVVLRPTNTTQGSGPRAARLDISPDEYFLVENRRDVLYEHLDDVVCPPYLNRHPDTGVILWVSRADTTLPALERRSSGEYDYFISAPTAPDNAYEPPCNTLGFGLLVWHVDERRLIEGYATNEVNTKPSARALSIVEASGDYEIGDWQQPSIGFVGDGYNDPFREGYKTELRATTVPNNWNSDWACTGWEITNVENMPPESHQLSVRVLDGVPGWPQVWRRYTQQDSLPPFEPRGALLARVSGLGKVLVMPDSAGVFAIGPNGRRLLHRGLVRPASLAYLERWAPGDTVGTLAALDSTRLWAWDARLAGDSLAVRAGFPITVEGGSGARLVLWDEGLVTPGGIAERKPGGWQRFTPNGTSPVSSEGHTADPVVGLFTSGSMPLRGAFVSDSLVTFDCMCIEPVPGPRRAAQAPFVTGVRHGLDAPDSLLLTAGGAIDSTGGTAQVVVLRRDGALRVVDPVRGVLPGFQDLPRDTYIGLALGDLNGDGELDIVAASPTRIVGETSRGARLMHTPIVLQDAFPLQHTVHITTGPRIADVAGDALPEILVGTDLGLVYVLDAGGRPVPGTPRKILPDLVSSEILVGELDGDTASTEILAASAMSAAALSLEGGSTSAAWSARGGDMARRNFTGRSSPVQVAERLQRLEKPLLVYPNPSRDGLVQLRITSSRAGPYDLRIYNLEGQQVFATQGTLRAGTLEIPWRCTGCASGVYLARFVSAAAGVPSPMIAPITMLR